MATIDMPVTIDLSVLAEQIDAAKLSVASLGLPAERLAELVDGGSPDAFVLLNDGGDLIRGEPLDRAAAGAAKLHGVEIKPSDRYLELVAAVAADRDAHVVRTSHGWPILSVAVRTTTVAGRGEVASLSPEGRR